MSSSHLDAIGRGLNVLACNSGTDQPMVLGVAMVTPDGRIESTFLSIQNAISAPEPVPFCLRQDLAVAIVETVSSYAALEATRNDGNAAAVHARAVARLASRVLDTIAGTPVMHFDIDTDEDEGGGDAPA